MADYPFVQARHFTVANRTAIDWIVIHDEEYPEIINAAQKVAEWFAGPNAPQASAHFLVDDKEVVQSVLEKDVAWHAPGANTKGIGIEHAGYAAQTREQWTDSYSLAELHVSAKLVASLCAKWNIPIVWLSADDLKAGKRGITGHKQVTDAFNHGVGHWDPGPNFPAGLYLAMITNALLEPAVVPADDPPIFITPDLESEKDNS